MSCQQLISVILVWRFGLFGASDTQGFLLGFFNFIFSFLVDFVLELHPDVLSGLSAGCTRDTHHVCYQGLNLGLLGSCRPYLLSSLTVPVFLLSAFRIDYWQDGRGGGMGPYVVLEIDPSARQTSFELFSPSASSLNN